jgi:hypothetical protein
VLTANNLAELADLDPLRGFARLTHVVLMENPVTRKEVRVPFLTQCPLCTGLIGEEADDR